jgi:hypothetical protein
MPSLLLYCYQHNGMDSNEYNIKSYLITMLIIARQNITENTH